MSGDLCFSGGKPSLDLKMQAALLNQVSEPIVASSLGATILTWNHAAEDLFRVPVEQARGRPCADFVDDTSGAVGEAHKAVGDSGRWSGELDIYGENQAHVHCQATCSLIRDPAGNGLAVVTILRDVTAARAAEQERVRAIENLRQHALVLEQLSEAVIGVGPDWRFRTWNRAAETIFGWSAAEILGRTPGKLPAWPSEVPILAIGEALKRTGAWSGELAVKVKDGRRMDIFARVTRLRNASGESEGAVAVIHDITPRKEADDTIRRLARLADSVSDAICSTDLEYRIQTVNRAAQSLYGWKAPEMTGRDLHELLGIVYPEGGRAKAHRQLLESGAWTAEVIHHRQDQRPLTMLESRTLLRDSAGIPTGIVSVARDLTYLKEAEEILAVSEERFRAVVETARDAIVTTDNEGRIIFWNNAAAEIFGYRSVEIVGESAQMLLPDKARAEQQAALDQASAQASGPHLSRTMETTGMHRDGREIPLEFSLSLWEAQGRRFYTFILRDITERRKAEAERNRLEKLDSLGVLAGGIAHDFNNILTAILGNISLARLEDGRGSAERLLLEAEDACRRATGLTRQLLTFAKGGAPVKEAFTLPEFLRESVDFALRGTGVRTEFVLEASLPPVNADRSQLAQVVHNIVLNAAQAMGGAGSIWIRARRELTAADGPAGLETGLYARVEIQDSGPGIPPDVLEKIFDPYFTTKPGGTGLGLCVSQSIMRRHGGILLVDSPPSRGAIFTLFLPLTDVKPPPPAIPSAPAEPGQGRLLIMDDEPSVRQTSARLFQRLGYQVTLASTGEEAVRLYREAQQAAQPFGAVILDLTVRGGMGGRETLTHLQALDPAVRAIVSSGYAENEALQDYRAHGFKATLPKPYSVDFATRVVREVFAGEAKPPLPA
jgi:PAS domain S-box-containing protein